MSINAVAVQPKTEFKTEAEKCTFEIINFLICRGLWQDTFVYVGNKRYGCYDGKHYHYDNNWSCVFREDDKKASDYLEYHSNFITMTFEGPFYEIVNYDAPASYCNRVLEEFNNILKKYGTFYEVGYAWSLAIYKQ